MVENRQLVVGEVCIDKYSRPVKDCTGDIVLTPGSKLAARKEMRKLGGNAGNVVEGLYRMGIRNLALYTYLGNRQLDSTKFIRQTIGNSIRLIADIDETVENSEGIILEHGPGRDREIISLKPERDHTFKLPKTVVPNTIFLTSIGDPWDEAYSKVVSLVRKRNIPLALSPGSAQISQMGDSLFNAIAASNLLFINKGEAGDILRAAGMDGSYNTMVEMLSRLQQMGPRIVSVTDGANPTYVLADSTVFALRPFSKQQPQETTGAGDAYASAFYSSFLKGYDIPDCIKIGSVNAASVIQYIGARDGLLSEEKAWEQLNSRPDYQVSLVAKSGERVHTSRQLYPAAICLVA